MDIFLNPNVAYVILLTGIVLSLLAVTVPGTGLLELTALFCLFFAGYAAYYLSIRWWALVILVLSIVPFVLAVRGKGNPLYLGISIGLLILGSLFLFTPEEGLISVNPVVAVGASGLVALALWFVLRKSIEVMARQPSHDLDALVGQIGEAKSVIHHEGNVYVGGELWSARSEAKISAGSHVRVVRREGFSLVVEKVDSSS